MARWSRERRRKALVKGGFSVYYSIFLLFIYGPMIAMFILSFQGRRGGTSFPMRGASFYWWEKLLQPSTVGDLQGALGRSLILAIVVMIIRVAVQCVAVPAEPDLVDGQRDDRAAGVLGLAQLEPGQGPDARRVELEPERATAGLGHLLNARRGARGQDLEMVLPLRGARHGQLAFRVERLLGTARGQNDRARELRAEDLGGGVEIAHVHQASRSQLELPEGLAVGPECELVLDAHGQVRVVPREQLLPRHGLEVKDVDRVDGGAEETRIGFARRARAGLSLPRLGRTAPREQKRASREESQELAPVELSHRSPGHCPGLERRENALHNASRELRDEGPAVDELPFDEGRDHQMLSRGLSDNAASAKMGA